MVLCSRLDYLDTVAETGLPFLCFLFSFQRVSITLHPFQLRLPMSEKAPATMERPQKGYINDEERNVGSKSEYSAPENVDQEQEILAVLDLDPALNRKMHLVNNVRDDHICEGQFSIPSTNSYSTDLGRDWLDTISLEIVLS